MVIAIHQMCMEFDFWNKNYSSRFNDSRTQNRTPVVNSAKETKTGNSTSTLLMPGPKGGAPKAVRNKKVLDKRHPKSFKMSQLFSAGKSQQGRSTGNKNRGASSGSERLYENTEKDRYSD